MPDVQTELLIEKLSEDVSEVIRHLVGAIANQLDEKRFASDIRDAIDGVRDGDGGSLRVADWLDAALDAAQAAVELKPKGA